MPLGTTCTVTGPAGCLSGTLMLGGTCSPNLCPVTCCDPTTDACSIVPQSSCAGVILPLGIVCNPYPCPPIPHGRNVTIDASATCTSLTVNASVFDDGSTTGAPSPCPLTFTVSPPGPYPVGTTTVTFTVTDCEGHSASVTVTVTVLGSDCNGNGIPDVCECYWTNATVDPASASTANGQLSHIGGGAGAPPLSGQRVADDFYVEPSRIDHVSGFTGWMLTNSFPGLRKARLDFYDDCDGAPALVPFKSYLNSMVVSTTPGSGGFDLVEYSFSFCDDPLWLDGGRGGRSYWVSLVGLTDGQGTDLSYWVAAPGQAQLLGSVPVKAVGAYAPPPATMPSWGPWNSIATCCIGCVNMVYALQGESCPIIWDNGAVDLGAGRGGSPSMNIAGAVQSRSADDFLTQTCVDQQICYIDAWIWTNCNPADGFIEIYTNECEPASSVNAPTTRPGGNLPSNTPFLTLTPNRVIPTGETAVINGATMNGYQLQFFPPPMVALQQGQTFWLSAGGLNLGNIAGRAYFAYSTDCTLTCPIRLNPGVTRLSVTGQEQWQYTAPPRSFAFRVAVKNTTPAVTSGQPGSTTPGCAADTNHDGHLNVQDLFDYLSAWFAGCP